MQYLKEEIKNRIVSAALQEFKAKGYHDASMRSIAGNAKVALGNVYRYFKNKDELFNSIMEPVYAQFTSLVLNVAKDNHHPAHQIPFKDIIDKVMQVFEKYSTELLIMIDKSKGSKYERVKEEFILLVDSRLKNELIPQIAENGIEVKDHFITYVLASSVVESIIIILRQYTNKEDIKYLVSQVLTLYFDNLVVRLK